ncbi:polyprotein [Rhynchospora pubera]|uniref:Polyprotein n=1 Tax=Rhynchospora pubera TaxID=906938 RepID=A0AAV8CGX2_9POAL|nr:polyprotein [Rhynchospora pubera]
MPPKKDNQDSSTIELSSQITAAVNAAMENHLASMRQELLAVKDSNNNSTLHIGGRIDSLETMFSKFLHTQNPTSPPPTVTAGPSGTGGGMTKTPLQPPRRNLDHSFGDFKGDSDNYKGEFNNTNYRCSLPRLEFSSFDGSDALTWEEDCEFYFDVFQTPEMYKTRMATTHFGGNAREWYRGFKMDNPHPPWPILVEEVKSRFLVNGADNPLEEFRKVIHLGKVDDYVQNFEKVKSRLMSSIRVTDAGFYLLAFLSGLRDEVRHTVEMCGPSSLNQAYKFAKQAELSLEGQERRGKLLSRHMFPTTNPTKFLKAPDTIDRKQPSYVQPHTKQLPAPQEPTKLTFDHMRKLGLCYWCGEKYHQGHKCQKKKLHLLEASEMAEGECSTDVEGDDSGINIQEIGEGGYEQADISMCSPQGFYGSQSLKFKGFIKQIPILALIDSGSTHSFIHPSIVHLNEVPTIPSPPMLVKTASGSKLLSDLKCQPLRFQLQNHEFEGDFRVLEVQGYDIILGMDWIAKVGPVVIDCVQGLVKLTHHDKEISLQVQKEVAEVKLCQGEICLSKEQKKGSDIILAQLFLTHVQPDNQDSPVQDRPPQILPQLQEVVNSFSMVFSNPSSLPPTRSIDHQIPLKSDAMSVNIRPHRFSHFQKLEIEKIVEELLESGYIRASTSPFASPILLVKKKDQTWRLCVDYRKLNDNTIKNKFPIPIIDDLLDELHGAKFFSKIDLKSGYHQIRMFEPDITKTAFRTHMGHYEFTVMPFGLTNAPATFQALMNSIFKPHLRKFILVFFDDILVYSTSLEEHKQHLSITLQLLQDNKLFAKLSKCVLGAKEVEYLGHIISEAGVASDPSKVSAMTEWPTQKTVKQLRGFLGLTGYYRKFIKGYGMISRPLTDLLKKEAFLWNDSADMAFQQLKSAMSQAPVLALPDFSKPFIIETDASQQGIGAVLMQEKEKYGYLGLNTLSLAMPGSPSSSVATVGIVIGFVPV